MKGVMGASAANTAELPREVAHGNYVTYVKHACRCEHCREAHRAYERDLARRKAYAAHGNTEGWPWIDPEPVREHVRYLVSQGMGWQTIARLAGTSHGHLSRIIYGDYGRDSKPSARVHRDTARRILAVSASQSRHVSAETTWDYIECLNAYGVTYGRIGKALGQSRGLQLSRSRITRKHAETIARLHWSLWKGDASFRGQCKCPRPESILEEVA